MDHGYQLLFQLSLFQRLIQIFIKQFEGILEQPIYLNIEMTVFAAGLLDRIEQRSLYPHRVMEIAAGFPYNFIYPAETEARHLTEPEQTFTQQLHALHSKML